MPQVRRVGCHGEIHDKITMFDTADDKAALKAMERELAAVKQLLNDVMANFNKRLADLNRALAAAAKSPSLAPAQSAVTGAASAEWEQPTTAKITPPRTTQS